jgi:hypothetical protein
MRPGINKKWLKLLGKNREGAKHRDIPFKHGDATSYNNETCSLPTEHADPTNQKSGY